MDALRIVTCLTKFGVEAMGLITGDNEKNDLLGIWVRRDELQNQQANGTSHSKLGLRFSDEEEGKGD
ncbi:hypothetical protein TorRG33x02_201720 [Trema orientale]|uniref:Uncharacterized protein n=1 Tax=Trema orientale TaxID=63057 RepID=A0A2P5EEV1_TREOI|nr:hypothetical protein TorRG33x02_201720 [Trema orientale]